MGYSPVQFSPHNGQLNKFYGAIILITALCVLSACGSRFLYNNIGFLVVRSMDGYFDLDSSQKTFLKERIRYHLEAHRIEGIPRHITFIKNTQERIRKGINEDDVRWFFDGLNKQVGLLTERFSDDFVDFLMTLRPEQVDHLEAKLADQNKENKERKHESAGMAAEEKDKRTIKSFEKWLGPISPGQKKRILELNHKLAEKEDTSDTENLEQQGRFLKILRSEPRQRREVKKALLDMLNNSGDSSGNAPDASTIHFLVEVDRLITQKQRDHLIDKLDGWVKSLEGLVEG